MLAQATSPEPTEANKRGASNTRPMKKKLRCVLGFHSWALHVSGEERYLKCRYCGKYGRDPGSFSGGWGYRA